MASKAFTPDQNNRPAPRSGEKGYSGHNLPAKPQQPTKPPSSSEPTSSSSPKTPNTEKK